MNEYKILITGTMGAGKTTAIAAISEVPPIMTDVQNNDTSNSKLTTTVGLDYGELSLDGGDKLRIYGTPGQERFAFMWKVLAKGALKARELAVPTLTLVYAALGLVRG